MDIRLHKEHGINPKLIGCQRCGESTGIVLLGDNNSIHYCSSCNMNIVSTRRASKCPNCKENGFLEYKKEVDRNQLNTALCDKCIDELEKFKEEVETGGIYWKCKSCPGNGVLKASSQMAKAVREEYNITPPNPIGIEFPNCPNCNDDFYKEE